MICMYYVWLDVRCNRCIIGVLHTVSNLTLLLTKVIQFILSFYLFYLFILFIYYFMLLFYVG
jgi:hypothetical protein